jgi:hypothetical protein
MCPATGFRLSPQCHGKLMLMFVFADQGLLLGHVRPAATRAVVERRRSAKRRRSGSIPAYRGSIGATQQLLQTEARSFGFCLC